jgi:hypothetical protein
MDSANHIQIQIAQMVVYMMGFFGNCFLLKFGGSLHLNKQKNIRLRVWKIAGKTDRQPLLYCAFVVDDVCFCLGCNIPFC